MAHGKVEVREKSTGQVYTVWPVDARALLASGEYEPADDLTSRIAQGQPAYPLKKPDTAREAVTVAVAFPVPDPPVEASALVAPSEPKPSKRPPKR